MNWSIIQRTTFRQRYAGSTVPLVLVTILFYSDIGWADTGVSANAPTVSYYAGLTESCCGEDPHPVHGVATPDGGFVVVGKTITAGDGWAGFAVKVGPPNPIGIDTLLEPDESPAFRWAVHIGQGSGKSVFLNAAATQDAVFLAGMKTEGNGNAHPYLAKRALEDGRLIWEKSFESSQSGGHGAIEAIQITTDGGLVAVGLMNTTYDGLEGFKSFGNPFGGQAYAFGLTPAQIRADRAPERTDWTRTYDAYETIKAVREVPGPEGGFIFLVGSEEAPPTLIRANESGDPLWERSYPGRFEATDIALHVVDGVHHGYTFTGHGGDNGTLDGQLTRVGLDGAHIWAHSFGNPSGGIGAFSGLTEGDPQLIFDECWGIQGLPDGGNIVACGTGIEGCELVNADAELVRRCRQDPRQVWRGYVVRFDPDGQVVWQRTDSFAGEDGEAEVSDSASEYVALMPNGGFMSVVDQGFGIGLLALAPEGSNIDTVDESETMPGSSDGQGQNDPNNEDQGDETLGEDDDEENPRERNGHDDAVSDRGEESRPSGTSESAGSPEVNEPRAESNGCAVSQGQIPWSFVLFGGLLIVLRRLRRS